MDPSAGRDDPALEQLQRAAHQMVGAARNALDAIDDLISDRERLGAALGGVTDLLERVGRAMGDAARPGAPHGTDSAAGDTVRSGDRPPARRARRIPVDE